MVDMTQRDREFCNQALAHLKRALPKDESDPAKIELSLEDSPVLTDLNNGLMAAYLVDAADRYQYVQNGHLARADLTQAELHRLGVANLLALFEQRSLRIEAFGNCFAVLCGGDFEASALLIDTFWDEGLADLAPNGFIAAVPCRDILAFCDAANPSGLQELRQLIERARNADHPISSALYRRSAAAWEPYLD
ncbi:hypothetical protein [Bradyrhizobium sp. SZCCHNRI2007]|uniref:hypothetical protein n=1 Tax=unclassified Bradyrhizobium TaxID=2631580 RepID=UPI0039657F79